MTDWTAHVVFCDDIREEVNGKAFLIGAYQGDLLASTLPGPINLATYIDIRSLPAGPHTFHVSAHFDIDGLAEEVASISFMVTVIEPGLPTILKANGMQFLAKSPGILRLYLAVNNQLAREIDSLRIRLASPQS